MSEQLERIIGIEMEKEVITSQEIYFLNNMKNNMKNYIWSKI
jgi:hypothetical protein